MKIISLRDTEQLNQLSIDSGNYILDSLVENGLAMIVADKDTGKSRHMISTIYSLALNVDLVGMLPRDPEHRKSRKIVIWDSEDGVGQLSKRILMHLNTFSKEVSETIKEHVSIFDDHDEEGSKEYLFNQDRTINRHLLIKLKEQLQDTDILFIDTIRSAMGYGEEVQNDNDLKVMLTEICDEANCALVFTHHLRKSDVEKSWKSLNGASASGLSKTSAKTRVNWGLMKKDVGSDDTSLVMLKANSLSRSDRKEIDLTNIDFGEHSIPVIKELHDTYVNLLCTPGEYVSYMNTQGHALSDVIKRKSKPSSVKRDEIIEDTDSVESATEPLINDSTTEEEDHPHYKKVSVKADSERSVLIQKDPNKKSRGDLRRERFANMNIKGTTTNIPK